MHLPPTAKEKLGWIQERIGEGLTVYVCTYTHATKITQRSIDAWERAGRPLFKLDGTSLLMGRGTHYDCIDYCGLRAS